MCRHKHEGRKRCKSDTSEARRLRRKNKQALEAHNPIPVIEPAVISDEDLLDFPLLLGVEDMKEEAKKVAELLQHPQSSDPEKQREIDAIIERRVTYLGNALAKEAETRARFDQEKFERSYNRPSWETLAGIVRDCEIPAETNRQIKMRQEAVERLTEAYKSVLADIRPVGGDLKLDDSTDPEYASIMNNSVGKHFPADWIKASAEQGKMIVEGTPDGERSHYDEYRHYSDREDGARTLIQNSFSVEEEQLATVCNKLSEGGDKFEHSGETIDETGKKSYLIVVPKRVPLNPEKNSVDKDGKPVGNGWKQGYILNDDGTFSSEKQWYHHGYEEGSVIPTITIPPHEADTTSSISYHEFTHRAENVVGNQSITRMQDAFLLRRTTDASGKREPLTRAFPDNDAEMVRRDNFIIPYIGKEYEGTKHREVMAVASEAIFGGEYGGLLGLDKEHKTDTDHRAFALGLFATG